MSGIVISYRREDTEGSAGRLYDRLAPRYGDEFVFMDFYSIESGEDWLARIDETVASSDVMLAIVGGVSPVSVASSDRVVSSAIRIACNTIR